MNTADFQFAPGSTKKIIQWMQSTHPAHEKFVYAKSFFYRALARHEKAHEQPNMEPHRDRRGENRKKSKREDPRTVQLCDDLMSEPKVTAPKVRQGLRRHDITISVSMIKRIVYDRAISRICISVGQIRDMRII